MRLRPRGLMVYLHLKGHTRSAPVAPLVLHEGPGRGSRGSDHLPSGDPTLIYLTLSKKWILSSLPVFF